MYSPVSILHNSIAGPKRPVGVADGPKTACYRFIKNASWEIFVVLFLPGTSECICLFVLRFYGPVNPVGSCQAMSVYLTTRLLGRLSPLSG